MNLGSGEHTKGKIIMNDTHREASSPSTIKIWALVALSAAIVFSGCAGPGPYRTASTALTGPDAQAKCQDIYGKTDDAIQQNATNPSNTADDRQAFVEQIAKDVIDKKDTGLEHCWTTSYEEHATYDLYYAEFDDAGQATDIAKKIDKDDPNFQPVLYNQSQMYLIEKTLKDYFKKSDAPPLDIVVLTHGWHGTAKADDMYSIAFKAILQSVAAQDKESVKDNAGRKPRRVLGIEVAWRGNSFLHPAIPGIPGSANAANIWDRKGAAETVSVGSVHELLAFLNEFYLTHSCHGMQSQGSTGSINCDKVHLLSIGHSFGALINFRALIPRLESGLNVPPSNRVFGFGDMTILLNPAFEGSRFRPLFNNALSRPCIYGPYFGNSDTTNPKICPDATPEQPDNPDWNTTKNYPTRVQIPSVVTLQTVGDTATGQFFPIFRQATIPFQQLLSDDEITEYKYAVGWVPAFETHKLSFSGDGDDTCSPLSTDQSSTGTPSLPITYCPFLGVKNAENAGTPQKGLRLVAESPKGSTTEFPPYMPLWTVVVDESVMANHDDIWNPSIVRMISKLFRDAYEQTEYMHGRATPLSPPPKSN